MFSFYLLLFFYLLFSIFSCSIHIIDFILCHFLLSFSYRNVTNNALSYLLQLLSTHLFSVLRNDFLFTVYCFLYYLIHSMSPNFLSCSLPFFLSFLLTLLYIFNYFFSFLIFLSFSLSLFLFLFFRKILMPILFVEI